MSDCALTGFCVFYTYHITQGCCVVCKWVSVCVCVCVCSIKEVACDFKGRKTGSDIFFFVYKSSFEMDVLCQLIFDYRYVSLSIFTLFYVHVRCRAPLNLYSSLIYLFSPPKLFIIILTIKHLCSEGRI